MYLSFFLYYCAGLLFPVLTHFENCKLDALLMRLLLDNSNFAQYNKLSAQPEKQSNIEICRSKFVEDWLLVWAK